MDVVLWGNIIVPIVHVYRYRHGAYGRTSFVPLEDAVPPIVLGSKRGVVVAAGASLVDEGFNELNECASHKRNTASRNCRDNVVPPWDWNHSCSTLVRTVLYT